MAQWPKEVVLWRRSGHVEARTAQITEPKAQSLERVLGGKKVPYLIKRSVDTVKADDVRLGSDPNFIHELPNEVNMLQKVKFERPTRESISCSGPNLAGKMSAADSAATMSLHGSLTKDLSRMAKPSQTAGEEHANGSSSSAVPAPAALPQSPTQPETKRKHTDTDNGPNTSTSSQQKRAKVKDAMETGETTLDHADAQSPADGTPNGTSSAPGVDSSAYVAESPATPNATTPTAASSDAATPIAADASKADAHTDNEEEQEVQTEPSVLAVRRAADWAKDKPQYQVAVKWEGYADPTWHRLETLDNDRLVLELLFSEQVTEQPGMVKTRVCAAQPDDEEEGAKATGV
ncbi:hypothetical protein VSDG_09496 [Cytospora chrysosperma]|uniref:Vacuolar import/degradation Vid27 C-terminal domain-containing protein n=1 Tax=Cytospora chrysosperma TaxID=252740 RepID=A0A423VCR1_CYTCH|nr:hypothetical protein VSDG_09496 [Valsa sordida]